ncbi:MAG: tyrosine--tRNA ligase [Chloroflexi bacterium]|jgi:tyrosyl-tRNA synthetase|nr:tyrosine--tRNA ligase [Chloroflexota bacterium]MCH2313132.1 tyrosine--tRNA ligase [SAR202 cluster bacterium]MCS5649029.1 tyrosine--tRNA ligase [Dehalococcoidia bacterium]MEC7913356.1 tyrosine--tRNA ligase [Chloroflexota bacterium]HBF00026.1 tyrosine--tRNA ligase [Dehalococcoidia bacterium]|tara:strand:+ start:725 stop:1921 length:1197 start_codon:yes stop_codon:yes gene_type:complete
MPLTEKEDILNRGVEEIIVKSEFIDQLNSGQKMRLKMGFDPSAPDIHVGHAVGLRKLRQLQEMGHQVVLIVGDWTAQIGDPSGRSQTRNMLSIEEVHSNAQTYLDQFFKIVDKERTEIRWQSEWFGPFTLTNVIELTSRFTVAQILAREDFAKRFRENQPISITELLYPLLQGYDSVAIESDVEFGGTDQKFNLLVGRQLQQMRGMKAQQCFIMPLLPGTDGVQKMSKSLGNYIGIDEGPQEIFGKVMSIPDSLILPYFDWLTDTPTKEITEIRNSLESQSVNPIELKKNVAYKLVTDFHNAKSARLSRDFFEKTVQEGQAPDDIPEYAIPSGDAAAGIKLSNVLVSCGLTSSSGEARRLIEQGAVRINEIQITQNQPVDQLEKGILRAGRRRYVRLI